MNAVGIGVGTEKVAKLTAARIRTLAKPGKYGDGNGLYLNVTPTGTRSWIQRIVIQGRRRDLGLGRFPDVGLADARDAVARNRALIAKGCDPLAERRRSATPTFCEAAERVYKANRPRWRNGKHVVSWWQSLERHAIPLIGDIAVDRIDRSDVLNVLTPIWGSKPETARRVRQRIRAVLRWSMAHGYIDHNVAGEVVDGALPPIPRGKNHLRALPYQEVGWLINEVRCSRGSLAAKLCLEFVILTAARSGEARGATWDEVEIEASEWRLPAERMKANLEHRVPLSSRALEVVEAARSITDGSDLLFPSPLYCGRPISDMTLTRVLRRLGVADRATVHGFRSSFRDWAAECTDAPHAVMELSLAHAVGGAVEAAYARSTLFEKRRWLMEQWAAYLNESGDVVLIASTAGATLR